MDFGRYDFTDFIIDHLQIQEAKLTALMDGPFKANHSNYHHFFFPCFFIFNWPGGYCFLCTAN